MEIAAPPALLPSEPLPASFPVASAAPPADMDQRVILYGMTWKDYEILLAVRGDRAGVRMAYLDGAIELMSPSINHEGVKKTVARLVASASTCCATAATRQRRGASSCRALI